jgi:hypothetical protein
MDVMLWVCAGIAVAAALLGLAFLPRRSTPPAEVATPGELLAEARAE